MKEPIPLGAAPLSSTNGNGHVMTLAELHELLSVDERRTDGSAYAPCPVYENPNAFRLRIAVRRDRTVKTECPGGCREGSIAFALTRRTGRTITAEDLLNAKDDRTPLRTPVPIPPPPDPTARHPDGRLLSTRELRHRPNPEAEENV